MKKNTRTLRSVECRAEPVRGDARTMRFLGSTENVARDGGILTREGWDLEAYRSNPVFLYGHDHAGLPIGRTQRLETTERGLEFDVEFADRETYPFADTVYRLYRTGFLRSVSVGFRSKDERPPSDDEKARGAKWVSTSHELLELSAVPVGADPGALKVAARGLTRADVPNLRRIGIAPFEELAREVEKMIRGVKKREDGTLVAVLRNPDDFDEAAGFTEYAIEDGPHPFVVVAGMLEGEVVAQALVFGEGWTREEAESFFDENEATLLEWRAPEPPEEEEDDEEDEGAMQEEPPSEEDEDDEEDEGENAEGDAPPPSDEEEEDEDDEERAFRSEIAADLRRLANRLEGRAEDDPEDEETDADANDEGRSGSSAGKRDLESDPFGILKLAREYAGE